LAPKYEYLSTLDDTELVERIKAGDKEAFQLLFRKHQNWVYSKVYRILRNPQDTEEVFQDIFLKVWQRIDKWNPEIGNFQAWLNEVAKNTALDAVRKRKRIREMLESMEDESKVPMMNYESPILSPDKQVEIQEARRLIDQALDEISKPNHRIAWILRHLEGLSISEICKTLGCKENTAKIWIFRCSKELKRILTRKGLNWAT
jgi:RNA polymerase sigma-70 factor (ECF subfamily)